MHVQTAFCQIAFQPPAPRAKGRFVAGIFLLKNSRFCKTVFLPLGMDMLTISMVKHDSQMVFQYSISKPNITTSRMRNLFSAWAQWTIQTTKAKPTLYISWRAYLIYLMVKGRKRNCRFVLSELRCQLPTERNCPLPSAKSQERRETIGLSMVATPEPVVYPIPWLTWYSYATSIRSVSLLWDFLV